MSATESYQRYVITRRFQESVRDTAARQNVQPSGVVFFFREVARQSLIEGMCSLERALLEARLLRGYVTAIESGWMQEWNYGSEQMACYVAEAALASFFREPTLYDLAWIGSVVKAAQVAAKFKT